MRLALALGLCVVTLLAACGGDDDESSTGAAQAPETGGTSPKVEDPGAIHVHGLGVNPKDGALFVATHTGLFRAPKGEGTAERVANRYQDTMGFTVVGPNRFLGSGHPDAREDLPPFLGLIRSNDGGRSWQSVSLMGKADFHVLEAAGARVYGFGSNYETRATEFLVSNDSGKNWDRRSPPGGLVSLAIAPEDSNGIVGGVQGGPAEDGLYASADAGRTWQPLADRTGLLAWADSGPLFLVDAEGAVSRSDDRGESWADVGEIGGQPAAFEAAGDDLFAALHDGTVQQSTDGGRTWKVRSEPETIVTP